MKENIKELIAEFERVCVDRRKSINLSPTADATEQKMYESAGKPSFKENLKSFIEGYENYAGQGKGLNSPYYELRAQILEKSEDVLRCIRKQIFCEEIV